MYSPSEHASDPSRRWTVTAIGSTFTNATQQARRIELSSHDGWQSTLRQCLIDGCVAHASASIEYEDFDGYFFVTKDRNDGHDGVNGDGAHHVADAAMDALFEARNAIVGGEPCKSCGLVVSTRRHKCPVKEPKANVTDFALEYGIQLMSAKWYVTSDLSTRILAEGDLLPVANVDAERAVFPFGWSVTPDRRRMSPKLQAYLRDKADAYYDNKQVLKSHKAMRMLYTDCDEAGLPLFMPSELPGHAACTTFLVKNEKTYIERRYRRKLRDVHAVHPLIVEQTPYSLMTAKQLKEEWRRLFNVDAGNASVLVLRTGLLNNVKLYLTGRMSEQVTTNGPKPVKWHESGYDRVQLRAWNGEKLKAYLKANGLRAASAKVDDMFDVVYDHHSRQQVRDLAPGDDDYDDEECMQPSMDDLAPSDDDDDDRAQ